MEKVPAIICAAAILVLIIAGEFYLRLDKFKSAALFFLGKMNAELEEWLRAAERIVAGSSADTEQKEEVTKLVGDWRSTPKRKRYAKLASLNAIRELSRSAAASSGGLPEVSEELFDMCEAYNEYALRYNKMLEKSPYSLLNAVIHMRPLDELTLY